MTSIATSRISIVVIVIVDDDEPLRRALASMLQAAGFRVVTFGSAEEFLGFSERQITSCLILDVRLPGMSGVELQRCLIEIGQPVPIIFVTAHGDDNLRDVLLNSGAKGFLTKPVRRDVLLAAIGTAIGKTAEE
jgi:FixJ family two-component response regulator